MQMVSGLGGLRVKRYQPFFRQKQNFDENLWFFEKFFLLKMKSFGFQIHKDSQNKGVLVKNGI